MPTASSMDLSVIPKLNASTYVAHGHLLERQGNFERAERQYREALKLTPNLTSARNRLGITLNKLGRHPEATAEFRTAAAQAPGSAHLLNNLGFSLHLEGKYDEAEEALSQALGLRPTFRRARMNRALVLAKLGRYDDAFADFCLTGTEADAHYNLAVMQAESREYAEAAHSLERALTLNPEFADARQQLRQIARLAVSSSSGAHPSQTTRCPHGVTSVVRSSFNTAKHTMHSFGLFTTFAFFSPLRTG